MTERARRATAIAVLVLLTAGTASTATAAPTIAPSPPQRYIVETDAGVTGGVTEDVRKSGGTVKNVYSEALDGFSATLSAGQVRELRSDDRVRSVFPDVKMHSTATQTSPTWGLDRIDQRSAAGSGAYNYASTGAGVTAFVIDTGMRLRHTQFGTRATSGYDFVDRDTYASDCEGHGTHVAGTIGGSTYGAAKGVRYVSLRVLDCEGGGYFSDAVHALDWIIAHKPAGPSVVNMSLGGPAFDPVDAAVARTVAAGIPVVVAAGNEGVNACGQSPARVRTAITVAATDSRDARPAWSNAGSCVDLFAPGVDVRSASNASTSATQVMSGTSMAAPHVTGVVARFLQGQPKATPAQTTSALLAATTAGVVRDPSGAPNKLLYADVKPVSKPGVPASVTATASNTARTGTLAWGVPTSNGGTTITGYRVTRNGLDSSGAGPKTVLVSATTRSYTFSQLRAGSTYTFSVSAVNSVGAGSAVSKTITQAR